MLSTQYKGSSPKNPFVDYLNHEGIRPGEFSIMARVDQACVYDVIAGYRAKLPRSFVPTIEERSGKGAGIAAAEAYRDYRENRRNELMAKK